MEINFDEKEIQKRLAERRAKGMGLKQKGTPQAEPEIQEKEDTSPIQHFLTPKVSTLISLGCNVWLTGPAGSGKSKCIELVATSQGRPFYCPPIGRETTNAQLFGYFNASGNYVRTPIRQACEMGGVLHLEEIDFASPAVGTALNALLANDMVGFPDATIPKHPDFIILASANTYGTGANASYIGSQGLNAATLDRFVFLEFPYDNKMEMRIAPNKKWCNYVQTIRKQVQHLGLKHVVSPRATIAGGKMVNEGSFSMEEIEMMTIFKGLDTHTVQKIKSQPIF